MSTPRVIDILLVEDNATDAFLTREMFAEARVPNRVHVVQDGVEALAFLRGPEPLPDVILLDLNMPRMDGHEFLDILKSDAALTHLPVVVLTTSAADRDVERSYRLRANAYITKPLDIGAFGEIIRAFEDFWLTAVRLPPKNARRSA